VQGLIADAAIDAQTLRPCETISAEIPPAMPVTIDDRICGAQLHVLLSAEAARRGLSLTAVSAAIWGSNGAIHMLVHGKHAVQSRTLTKVRAWLESKTPDGDCQRRNSICPQQTGSVAQPGGGTASVPEAEEEEGARSAPVAPPVATDERAPSDLPDDASGADWAEVIRRAARDRSVSLGKFLTPFTSHASTWLEQLEKARRPRPRTVTRIRQLLSGQPVDPSQPNIRSRHETCRREDREALGLPPSGREKRDERSLELRAAEREREWIAQQAASAGASSRRPGETLAEAVEREAREIGARRSQARCTGSVRNPLPSRFEEGGDDEDVGTLAAERRERELRDVASPSALIRRATKEWPDKCNKVAGLAARMGVQLGEAWQRVIDAGVMTVSEDLLEDGI
jgi:hypothetical protein